MFIDSSEPKCSKCGSVRSETFQRTDCTGRRCLSCGHESIAPIEKIHGEMRQWTATVEKTF